MPTGYAISGYITRSNLGVPLANLPIQVDPYWTLLGGDSDAADMNTQAGVEPGISTHKRVWASSPYVAGQQLVLSTPDNSTLDLRLIVDGNSMADAEAKVTPIIVAITQQMTFEVSLTFDTAVYSWACYQGDYECAFNQLHYFGYLLPVYLSLPRSPIPITGPI